MRRPPQLWEQRLSRTTSILGVGISSSGDATAIVPPQPPPGAGGGTEPAPVLPPPGAFIKPSTPTLVGSVQGIRVRWDGLNADGDLWPYDTSYIEVHMDTTGTAFTPGTATLKGRLDYPGEFFVGGLTSGTTYYFRLRGADPAGNFTDPSDAVSGVTGLTTSSDYGTATIGSGAVSFNARQIGGVTNTVGSVAPTSPLLNDIWLDSSPGTAIVHRIWNGSSWVANAWGSASIAAGQITALQVAAGAITAGAIAAGAVTADKITADAIDGKTIVGATIKTSANVGTEAGVIMQSSGLFGFNAVGSPTFQLNASTGALTLTGPTVSSGSISGGTVTGAVVQSSSGAGRIVLNNADTLDFYSSNVKRGDLFGVTVSGINGIGVTGALDVSNTIFGGGGLNITTAAVDLPGAAGSAGATTADAGFNNNRLRAKSSNQKLKYDIAEVDGTLDGVDEARRLDVVTVDPTDVLDLGIAEFSWLEEGEPTDWRELGFIAQDVAAKFPIAASVNADGEAIAVRDTPLIAALIAVVRQQRDEINDLRSRIEALEA